MSKASREAGKDDAIIGGERPKEPKEPKEKFGEVALVKRDSPAVGTTVGMTRTTIRTDQCVRPS
jgi:hypothetical protein